MSVRKVKRVVRGQATVDGAGVHLVRVLGNQTVRDFDPFLMLDSFDSKNPNDYIKGFPMHPHRGIETITYLIEGEIDHQDSLGNKGVIHAGESQWMTAGSGILHQEMPQPAERMLGLQLWLNLPQTVKMTHPAYFDIKSDLISEIKDEFGNVRVISGEYKNQKGAQPPYHEATIYDVIVDAGKKAILNTKKEDNVFIFLIEGDVLIDGHEYMEKSAVLFDEGDTIEVEAPSERASRFIYLAGKPLKESVVWGGPIVMNTEEELNKAFEEYHNGTFIKEDAIK